MRVADSGTHTPMWGAVPNVQVPVTARRGDATASDTFATEAGSRHHRQTGVDPNCPPHICQRAAITWIAARCPFVRSALGAGLKRYPRCWSAGVGGPTGGGFFAGGGHTDHVRHRSAD